MKYEELWRRLTSIYEAGEAKAIVRWVLEMRYGLTMADILFGKVEELTGDEQDEMEGIIQRLLGGEPVQYVLGATEFCGRMFGVGPGVLIPRPETEELCRWILESCFHTPPSILDIGTGSGCIAVTLACEIASARVCGWDVSPTALHITQQNAGRNGVSVMTRQCDVLKMPCDETHGLWDVIVSNPPYICQSEAKDMAPWVLNHEPEEALFVPDDDPLLFYRHIGHYAKAALNKDGMLYFEVNPLYVGDIEDCLRELGFSDIKIRRDQFDKERFIRACR